MEFHASARRDDRDAGMTFRRILAVVTCVLAFIIAAFGIGLIASHCERYLRGAREVLFVDRENPFRDVANQLDRRQIDDDCNSTDVASLATAPASAFVSASPVLSEGAIAAATRSTAEPSEVASRVSIPISTRTHTQTIYTLSLMTSPVVASEIPICSNAVSTVTITYTVLPSAVSSSLPPWLSSSALGDITVTAGASTITDVNTQVSFETDLPDVTVTGGPSTLTNVQTEVSLTSDLPDATVSANPSTVTSLQTKTSLVTLPNGQVSTTIVITDLWSPPEPSLVTFTAVSTVKTTITTVHPPPVVVTLTPRPADTTVTELLTTTNSEPLTLTTTFWTTPVVTHSGNKTVTTRPSGTASSSIAPTSPIVVVISAGAKSELPLRDHLGCFVIVLAGIMLLF